MNRSTIASTSIHSSVVFEQNYSETFAKLKPLFLDASHAAAETAEIQLGQVTKIEDGPDVRSTARVGRRTFNRSHGLKASAKSVRGRVPTLSIRLPAPSAYTRMTVATRASSLSIRLALTLTENLGVGRVSIRRVDSGYRDAGRRYRILIDDEEVGRVKQGEAIELQLSPGVHVIQAAIDWKRSDRFEISGDAEETFRFRCGPRRSARWALFDLFKRRDNTWLFLEPDTV